MHCAHLAGFGALLQQATSPEGSHPPEYVCLHCVSCCAAQTLEMELPDTAASLRLSSLELSDCMSELGALGNDVSSGVRSAARVVSATEAGVKQGVQLVGAAVVPALARRETRVRGRWIWVKSRSREVVVD
jgi:hypothetical protein